MALEHEIENLKKILEDFCCNFSLQLDCIKAGLREKEGKILDIKDISTCPRCGCTDIVLSRDFDDSLLKAVGSAQAHGLAVEKLIGQNSTLGLKCRKCGREIHGVPDFKTLADEWNKYNEAPSLGWKD